MCFALRRYATPLPISVLHVLQLGARPQMIFLDAMTNVAGMANKQTARYFLAIRVLPRNDMDATRTTVLPNHSISARAYASIPQPTSVWIAMAIKPQTLSYACAAWCDLLYH